MLKGDAAQKLEVEAAAKDTCLDCLLGKQCRVSHGSRKVKATEDTSFLHFDTCGPMSCTNLSGNKYFVFPVGEFSNYRFVAPVKLESDCHDNGTEFCNSDLRQ